MAHMISNKSTSEVQKIRSEVIIMTLMEVMNGPLLYGLVIAGLLIIFGIALFFFRRAKKRADELGISKEQISSIIKSSIVFTIEPSISIIIGLITLTPLLGVPWPWFRLSVVGALGYELMAADLAVKGAGFQDLAAFNTSGDISVIGTIMLVMSISIMAGMVFNVFFLKKVHTGVLKAGEKENPFVDLALSVLTVGIMSVFVPVQFLTSNIHAIVLLISAATTFILTKTSQKYGVKWMGDYVMSFALIIGMVFSVILTKVL